jgi:lathosterol oxidase
MLYRDILLQSRAHNFGIVARAPAQTDFWHPTVYAWALPHPRVRSGPNSSAVNNLLAADAVPTSLWNPDNIYCQINSPLIITQLGASILDLLFSAISYGVDFDRRLEYPPRVLKNQVRQEIKLSMSAVPFTAILTLP